MVPAGSRSHPGPLADYILRKKPLKVTLDLPEFTSREATLRAIQPNADLFRSPKGVGGKGRR